jgi:hypothetical protein
MQMGLATFIHSLGMHTDESFVWSSVIESTSPPKAPQKGADES